MKNIFKTISLLSYCFILLMGMLIPVPFILWLIGSLIVFENFIDQFFAFLGLTGILLNIIPWKNGVLKSVISFIFMTSPLIVLFLRLSFDAFNYAGFILPLVIFIVSYFIFIILQVKTFRDNHMIG